MSIRNWTIVVCVVAALAGVARADSAGAPATDPGAVLAQADALFEQASKAMEKDPSAARALFAQSAAAYQALVDGSGIRHASLYTNLGNARLLSGDVGRAIADLRRAERLDPTSVAARKSLAAARSRVGATITPDTAHRALDILLVWRRVLPREAVLWVGVAAWVGAWGLGAVRVWRGDARPRAGWVLVCAAGAALCLGGLMVEEYAVFRVRDAVVVGEPVVGRLGPDSAAYEPSFDAPLPPGVEGRVIGTHGAWRELRLADSRTTWVPDTAIDEIVPTD